MSSLFSSMEVLMSTKHGLKLCSILNMLLHFLGFSYMPIKVMEHQTRRGETLKNTLMACRLRRRRCKTAFTHFFHVI